MLFLSQGDAIDLGLTDLHYDVDIGLGSCRDVRVLSNVLKCKPPSSKPKSDSSGDTKKNAVKVVVRKTLPFFVEKKYQNYISWYFSGTSWRKLQISCWIFGVFRSQFSTGSNRGFGWRFCRSDSVGHPLLLLLRRMQTRQ